MNNLLVVDRATVLALVSVGALTIALGAGTASAENRTYVGLARGDGGFDFRPAQDRPESDWAGFEVLLGDVNGDGRSDLIWNVVHDHALTYQNLGNKPSGEPIRVPHFVPGINRTYVGLARADGTFDFRPPQDRPETGWKGYRALVGDLNGDSFDDLVWNVTGETNRTYVGFSRGDGTFDFRPAQDRPEKGWQGYQALVANVNGDGLDDLVWNVAGDTNRTYVGLSRGDGTFDFRPPQDWPETGWQGYELLIGDLNGDGADDLIWNDKGETNRTYVGFSRGDGTFDFRAPQDRPESGWQGYRTLIGDVNGDRFDDLIWNVVHDHTLTYQNMGNKPSGEPIRVPHFVPGVNRTYVGFSRGDGTFDFRPAQDRPETGWRGYVVLVGDVNGDRLDDLIWNATDDTNRTYVSLSRGDGTFDFRPPQDRSEPNWQGFRVLVGDVNGDRLDDLVWNRVR